MISEFKAGEKVCQAVIVRVQKIGTASTGRLFAKGLIEDNSGRMPFICFDEEIAKFLSNVDGPEAYMMTATVDINKYANDMTLQVLFKRLDPIMPEDDISHLLPMGDFDHEAYKTRLDNYIKGVRTPGLRMLLETIFSGATYDAFLRNPAGMRMHHAYIGGLLQHSVDVADLAVAMATEIGGVDKDLVVAGALLHDLGKLKEISAGMGFPYTDEGRLMGHIAMTSLMVQDAASKLRLPANQLKELHHILLSHHGENEKGSPVACSTKEAFIVHYADEINAIMNQFDTNEGKATWEYNRMLQRFLMHDKP